MATSRRVAPWLLPAQILSALPATLVGTTLAVYLNGQGATATDIAESVGAAALLWRLVGLWVVPLEFATGKRRLILIFQLAMSAVVAAMGVAAFTSAPPTFFLVATWLLAFLGASHDGVLDGLYVSELGERAQIKYQFIAPLFWNIGRMGVAGFLVLAVSQLEEAGTAFSMAWTQGLAGLTILMSGLTFWQSRTLPDPVRDEMTLQGGLAPKCVAAVKELAGKASLVQMLAVALVLPVPAYLVSDGLSEFANTMANGDIKTSMTLFAYISAAPFLGSLIGMLWVLRKGLEQTFLPLVVLFNGGAIFGIIAAALGVLADPALLELVLFAGHLLLSLAWLVTPLYVMQQIAPGRFSMSAYVLTMAAAQLVRVPLGYAAETCRENLGFLPLFLAAGLLGGASIWLAKRAPFLHEYRGDR